MSAADPEPPHVEHDPTITADDTRHEQQCSKVSDNELLKMAHIQKTKPRPCDKQVDLYTLNQNAQPFKASMKHCFSMDYSSCSRSVGCGGRQPGHCSSISRCGPIVWCYSMGLSPCNIGP